MVRWSDKYSFKATVIGMKNYDEDPEMETVQFRRDDGTTGEATPLMTTRLEALIPTPPDQSERNMIVARMSANIDGLNMDIARLKQLL